MKLKTFPFSFVFMALAALAQAETSTVEFTMTQPPALGSDAGHWTSDNSFTSWSELGVRNPTTGVYEDVGGNFAESWRLDPAASQGPLFGNFSHIDPDTGHGLSTAVQIQPGAIHNSITLDRPSDVEAFVFANVRWTRSFHLNPHSSVSFSGIASFGGDTDAGPPRVTYVEWEDPDPDQNFAYLLNGTGDHQTAAFYLGGLAWDEREGDVAPASFSYVTGPDGAMSLTMTNTSDRVLAATLEVAVGNLIEHVPAVPEPEAVLMFLLGLGAIGSVARKRKVGSSPSQALS